jgi:pyruvate/2-oxoglutarate dehydrogenase complex dihydrolipoamide dehydrogenase (E3) component
MSNAAQEVSTDATYDVIGAGPVGLSVAARSRAGGLSVAVVEKELVGGECSYWACIPSKAMLRPVFAVAEARRLDGAPEAVNAPIDAVGVSRRRDRYVGDWDETGQVQSIADIGADLVRGHGRLDGPRRVAVVMPQGRIVLLASASSSSSAKVNIPGRSTSMRTMRWPISDARFD